MLHAVATLYLALSRAPPAGYAATRLPGVLHLTVYSGRQRWTGAGEVAELIAAGSGSVPRMACPVLELRHWQEPGWEKNLAVLVARLQRCADPEALHEAAAPPGPCAFGPGHAELASAVATWITHVLLLEMLETEPRRWADRIRDEGRAEGHHEGREEGLARERKLLLRQARVRFGGALAGSLAVVLEGIADTDRLEEIAEWLLVCDSGEALLARLRQV